MATSTPAKKNAALVLYVGLVSQANTNTLQANPTIAAGDFKISTDGGAFGNLATLPVVTPAGGTAVKLSLSAGEMNGDDIVIACIDVAGSEWCDRIINIKTAARWVDDLAFPITTGNGTLVDSSGKLTLTATEESAIASAVAAILMLDLSAVPASAATLQQAVSFNYMMARNQREQTATIHTLRKNDNTTAVGTSTESDDGTTFTRGKFS